MALAQEAPPETAQDIDELIAVLEDDTARQRLIDRLVQLNAASTEPVETDAVNQLVTYLEDKQRAVDDVVLDIIASTAQIPEFLNWLQAELANPLRRTVWSDVALRLAAIFFGALAISWILKSLWRQSSSDKNRYPKLGAIFRDAAILATASIAAFVALYWLDQPLLTRLVGIDLVLAWTLSSLWRLALKHFSALFIPNQTEEETRRQFLALSARAGSIAIAGYFIMQAALRLGLPWSFHGFALHLIFLVAGIIAIVAVFRIREPVAEQIRSLRRDDPTFLTMILPVGWAAQLWHLVASLLIAAHFVTWALALDGGLTYLATATITTLVILVAARTLSLYNDRLFEQGLPIIPSDDEFMPDVQQRASRYANPIRLLLRWMIVIAMLLALSWVWRTGLVEWLGSPSGRDFLAILVRLGLLVSVTIILTEAIAIGVTRLTQRTHPNGQMLMSNRAQTLAAIFKNIAIVFVVAVALMLGLSELGVDAAALLAGAGVVGLAIGFGSQRLVQDLINGLFILLGDTVRVGDVVDVGKSGVVESISMRTITLRSYDGSVHTVPYSSIDTVTNMTKDFSFAVFDIGVSYGSDLELAFKELQNVDQSIRREWPYRRQILAPIEIAGVDALADSAVMIKARTKTRAGDQWSVRREMTKRIKHRFDEVGIEIPFPHRTLLITHEKKESS